MMILNVLAENSFLELITKPEFIIGYVVVIVFVMVLVVISVMINEQRFNKVTKRIAQSEARAEKATKAAEEQAKKTADTKNSDRVRFDMLHSYDNKEKRSDTQFQNDVTLKSFCEEFRLFSASKLGLYYDITDIREFIAGLAVSHIVILQGMSGTGKTSLAYAFGEFLENPSTIIPVQPMWKERTDLLGYYNEFTKRFNETLLLQKMYEANGREDMCITILDELNIARVEYYFAEFLSLLEIPNPNSRYLEVVSDRWDNDPKDLKDGRIKLPENMWFIGTANNDDSTFAISDKVYDRAMILNLNRKSDPFQSPSGRTIPITAKKFNELVQEAVEGYQILPATLEKLQKLDEYLIEKFQITFGNRIMRQIMRYLPIYVMCGGNELDALDDILMKKVFRKLETQNMAYIRSESEDLCNYMDGLFGVDEMTRCKDYVRRIVKNI